MRSLLSHSTARLRLIKTSPLSHLRPPPRLSLVRVLLQFHSMSMKTIAVLDESELKDGEM